MIADMFSNKHNPIVTEFFSRGKKLFESLQKMYLKTIFFFLVIDDTVTSDNFLRSWKNLLERI